MSSKDGVETSDLTGYKLTWKTTEEGATCFTVQRCGDEEAEDEGPKGKGKGEPVEESDDEDDASEGPG